MRTGAAEVNTRELGPHHSVLERRSSHHISWQDILLQKISHGWSNGRTFFDLFGIFGRERGISRKRHSHCLGTRRHGIRGIHLIKPPASCLWQNPPDKETTYPSAGTRTRACMANGIESFAFSGLGPTILKVLAIRLERGYNVKLRRTLARARADSSAVHHDSWSVQPAH